MHRLSMEVNLVRAQGPILQIDLINHDKVSLPYERMISTVLLLQLTRGEISPHQFWKMS